MKSRQITNKEKLKKSVENKLNYNNIGIISKQEIIIIYVLIFENYDLLLKIAVREQESGGTKQLGKIPLSHYV